MTTTNELAATVERLRVKRAAVDRQNASTDGDWSETPDEELDDALREELPILLACLERCLAIDGVTVHHIDVLRQALPYTDWPVIKERVAAILDAAAEAVRLRTENEELRAELDRVTADTTSSKPYRQRYRETSRDLAKANHQLAAALGRVKELEREVELAKARIVVGFDPAVPGSERTAMVTYGPNGVESVEPVEPHRS